MKGGGQSGVGLTKGSLLYQLANRETMKTDATRNDSLRVDSSTMLSRELGSTRWVNSVGCTETRSKCGARICIPHAPIRQAMRRLVYLCSGFFIVTRVESVLLSPRPGQSGLFKRC